MSDELDRVTERIKQATPGLLDHAPAASDLARPQPLEPGARVFDSISGLEARVTRVLRGANPTSPAVLVELANGEAAIRRPDQLIRRGAAPST